MRRRLLSPLSAGLVALLAFAVPGASAPLSERVDEQRGKVQRKLRQEGVLTQTISAQNNQIRTLQGEIRGLAGRQARIQRRLDEQREELGAVRDRLDRARTRLAELRVDVRRAEGALATRLVELYKADHPDLLTVVLEADGFADLLERTEFLERIATQDRRLVTRVRGLKQRAARDAADLARLERRAEQVANEILARRDEVAAVRARKVRSRTRLQQARDGRARLLNRLRSSRRRAQENLVALEREQERVRARLVAAQQPSAGGPASPAAAPVRRGGGRLIWPVNGPLTSPFGPRWGRLHAGIDIGAPEGTPIRAADSGRVVIAGWQGGYGLYTCIQHAGTFSTCYAHQVRLGTSVGASVKQGQVMGYVGNTGNSFGAHLHFETRVNGNPVDPMGYL
jgi:murein DD-endopeptidase MepM/ murein hydrolase activator NlpD